MAFGLNLLIISFETPFLIECLVGILEQNGREKYFKSIDLGQFNVPEVGRVPQNLQATVK